MTLLKLHGRFSSVEWLRREMQEACQHQHPNGQSAFLSGAVYTWRFDPELDRYASGPTYRRVCMQCDLVVDVAVPSAQLKPIIALNSPSRGWMKAHGFENWSIEEREIGRESVVQERYQQDQQVRAQLRTEGKR